jgi:hypothetical protein
MNLHQPPIDRADPLKILERMIVRLTRRGNQLEAISSKYWIARRILFLFGAVLSLFSCRYGGTTSGCLLALIFLIIFGVVASYHKRVRDSLGANSLMIGIKSLQVSRIHLDWDKFSRPTEAQALPDIGHPFESDLDITGPRSLHQLHDSAVTMGGSERLRSWLLNARPDITTIERRQSLVRELQGHSLFRDKLQLVSAVASQEASHKTSKPGRQPALFSRMDSDKLVGWITVGVAAASLRSLVVLLSFLAGLNIALIILAVLGFVPHVWPISLVLYFGVMNARQSRIATAWEELQELEKTLRRFRAVFQYLESRGYRNSPGLAEICLPFLDPAKRPSAELKRLERLAAALGLRTNAFLWLLVHAFVPWDFFFTHRLNLLKEELAELLPRWLDAWYELEALNSLANFAYLNSSYVFPDINVGPPVFSADALGHPLLKAESKVCNDFALDDQMEIAILTGSNMAGKSTFLRTVGVNLCLAYAGAPVNAKHLRVSLFRMFTCIKVSDSVQDGLSYFYAEVKRLKGLLSAAEETNAPPLMFLIDEIFRGTNSRERLIGARAFVRALSRLNTLGLIATHDLELVKLADEIAGATNFHFREEVRDGKMVFDYHLRPGPCPTTNALHIMRLEGLPVD